MARTRELRCYEYVTASYPEVHAALRFDPEALFQRATQAAQTRAGVVGATLRTEIGPFDVAVDIEVQVGRIYEDVSALGDRTLRMEITWAAGRNPGLFPTMKATLSAYPLSARETQLDLQGTYEPPFKIVGTAIDAVIGRRIAEAAILRFVRDIATRLSEELVPATPRQP